MTKFTRQWLLGFVLLIALDALMECYVFEWLAWNGTTKNDWFFILWWILVFGWAGYGIRRFIKK
jgi:hypothetical protein